MTKKAPKITGSLKIELTVMVTALVLVMNIVIGVTVTWIYSQALTESQAETGAAFARGAAQALGQGGDFSDFHWSPLIRAAEQSGLHLVLATDSRGKKIRHRPDLVTSRDETALRAALSDGRENLAFDGVRFSVAVPVVKSGRLVGALCFAGWPDELARVRNTSFYWALTALSFNVLLMSLFAYFFLNRRLVDPLRILAQDLNKLAHDKFELAERPRYSREIGGIFAAFDQAASELIESRQRLEEQLQTITDTRAQLVASEKMATVGRLASGLAHELGNPIGALVGFVYLLRRDDLSPEDKTAILNQSAHELDRMDGNIKELLHFSRPRRNTFEPVDAGEAAVAALNLARPQKWAAGVDFVLEIEPSIPMVQAERNSLLQVLLNLLANAGQALNGAGQTDGRVTVSITKTQKNTVRLQVTDNGPGVAPEDAPHLFEPYFSRKEPGQGTGLGLAISLSLIDGFGGQLTFSSAPDGGAAFSIILKVISEDGK